MTRVLRELRDPLVRKELQVPLGLTARTEPMELRVQWGHRVPLVRMALTALKVRKVLKVLLELQGQMGQV